MSSSDSLGIDSSRVADYKQPARNGDVSVSKLVELVKKLDMNLNVSKETLFELRLELDSIIEEIGEKW
jgi:hypothetical protein